MGVRKVMDLIFTQTELYWLDHMLPGEDRIKKEDEQVTKRRLRFILLDIINHCWELEALFGKTCATTQKNVKSHVFLDFEKNVKKRKKTYI